MKRKSEITFAVLSTVLVLLFITGRITNALDFYSMKTPTNYPTIGEGDLVFASNLKKPQRFDFIAYRAETPEFGKGTWIHRICGVEGDTIEIKNGTLYVNHQDADKALNLAHTYQLTKTELYNLRKKGDIDEMFDPEMFEDSIYTNVSDQLIRDHSSKATRYYFPKENADDMISKTFGKPWNIDHFGPVIVPKDAWFVLGDNRSNSMDSRFRGFIEKSKYVATIFGRD